MNREKVLSVCAMLPQKCKNCDSELGDCDCGSWEPVYANENNSNNQGKEEKEEETNHYKHLNSD